MPLDMKAKSLIISALFLVSLISLGCGGASNSPAPNGNANNTETKAPAADPNANAAPTLTPVFKAYCDAWVKKDEAALRKVYSADTIKYFEAEMKAEKVKTLIKFLEDDAVTGKICEVRNEVITGDKAIAEIRADAYPNGIKIEFVKEDGEWKMTNKSPVLDAVKPNAANAAPPTAPAASTDEKKK